MITDYGNPDASVVLIQPAEEHDLSGIEREVKAIEELAGVPFCLKLLRVENWNADLSPWPSPAVFGTEDFKGGAEQTLKEALKLADDRKKTYLIGGYSLAGLFALWAGYQTEVFSAVAAASPSMWYPGFTEYMRNSRIHARSVYLSLGDREARVRNPVMGTVEDRIREAHALLESQGTCTVLEWNRGNHFQDAELRTAKAFAWALRETAGS